MTDDLGLEPASTARGLLEDMMLHETLAPLNHGYGKAEALRAMRLIRQVIENRTRHPQLFGRKGTPPGPGAAYAIMTVKQAFEGFADAPDLKANWMKTVNDVLKSARDPADSAHQRSLDHVKLAVLAATEPVPPADVVRRNLYYWLAVKAGKPKGVPVFLLETLQGNNFWGQNIKE